MRIGRTIPPAAAPIPWKNVLAAAQAAFSSSDSGEGTFENQLKDYFGVKHCFLVSSGKAALTLILQALHRLEPDRHEVVIPAFTCFSVPASIYRAGLQVTLCDITPDSLDFNRSGLRQLLDSPDRAHSILSVIPTHFYGIPTDLQFLKETTGGKDIPLVEDAAQSMGEETVDGKLGTLSDIGFFSLGRGKALSCSNGGIIVTDRDDIASLLAGVMHYSADSPSRARVVLAVKTALVNILIDPSLYWLPKSLPFLHLGETLYEEDFELRSFSPVQRRLAESWQKRLADLRQARRKNGAFFADSLPAPFRLLAPNDFAGSMIRMPVLAPSKEIRKTIVANSEKKGLGIMPVYPSPVHRIEEIADDFKGEEYPNAEELCAKLFTLPVHPLVSPQDRERIIILLETCCSG